MRVIKAGKVTTVVNTVAGMVTEMVEVNVNQVHIYRNQEAEGHKKYVKESYLAMAMAQQPPLAKVMATAQPPLLVME